MSEVQANTLVANQMDLKYDMLWGYKRNIILSQTFIIKLILLTYQTHRRTLNVRRGAMYFASLVFLHFITVSLSQEFPYSELDMSLLDIPEATNLMFNVFCS